MILDKLLEALASVQAERQALDETEAQLRAMIARHGSHAFSDGIDAPIDPTTNRFRSLGKEASRNGLDDIVDVLRESGHPLHITAICERLSAKSGGKIVRTDIEPGLNRHVSKTKKAKIVKTAPSTYGLPEWQKSQEPSLLSNVA